MHNILRKHASKHKINLKKKYFESIGCEELWFKTGVRDHLRYVPVYRLSENLGQKLCRCLPAFHALTGCDTTSTLAGVSKKKAWERLNPNEVHQDKLELVGQSAALDDVSRQRAKRSSVTYTLQ